MQMPGRQFTSATGYRYGFNGKEKDDEVKGNGNQQDFKMRIYDPRLAKFLSIDPSTKNYCMLTPYQFASNRPIDGIDLDGLEHIQYLYKIENGKATLIDVHKYGTDLEKGHGVEVVIVSNGEVTHTFIPMSAPPKPHTPTYAEEHPIAHTLNKLDAKMRGKTYGELEGEKGLKSYSKGLKITSKALKVTPLAPVGKILSYGADAIDTGLDFKNKDAYTATANLAVRVLGKALGESLGKALKGVNRKDLELGVGSGVDKLKEALIKK